MTREKLRELVERHGFNTNHFLTLYEGFEYFESPRGCVPFYERGGAWVAAGEPLAARDEQLPLWEEFCQAARAQGKRGVCIPVAGDFVERARAKGFGSLMVGAEPLFDLERYPKSGQTWVSVVPTAKQLHGKGARVSRVDVKALAPEERARLDEVTAEWLASRKMEGLSFLNKVEPWTESASKKFFKIEHGGRMTAFVAAIPITARKGWYLVDVMRRQSTEPGTTELLLLETMRLLKEEGAREVTFGVAPLAGLENAPEKQRLSKLGRALAWAYERGDQFYNFRTLHQYKLKFQPSRVESAYIVFDGEKLGLRCALGLLSAFVPHGLARAGLSGTVRMVRRFDLQAAIKARVAPSVVVRSAPASLMRLLYRCRVTALLALAWWAMAAATLVRGALPEQVAAHWGYSAARLASDPVRALVGPPFLHWNWAHLASNTFLALVFCGLLEYLGGSLLVACAFGAGAAAGNTAASLVYLFNPSGMTELDVGASLGVLSCAGALTVLLRRGAWLFGALVAAAGASAAWTHSTLGLNHVVAVGVGWCVARLFLRS
jgi:hypothetical protein